jgi:hypothetical protein
MRYGIFLRQAFLRGSICSGGDLTCQYFKGGEKIDPYRAIGFFGYGFFSSPIIYKTFSYMNKINGLSNLGIIKTATIYETIIWPTTMMPILYATTEIAKGKTFNQSMEKMKKEGFVLAATSAVVWIPISFIQQKYVPMKYMILFRSSCCSLSAVAMSYYTNRNN